MPQIQELKVLDIDGQKFLVEDMSDEVQALVDIYNEWNQDFADAKKTAGQLQAAVQMAHSQLSKQIKDERAAEMKAAAEAAAEKAEANANNIAEAAVDGRFGQEQKTDNPEYDPDY